MFEFKLPDLGEGINEGELLKWYVKENDFINEDDPLCDIETDKAAVTIPSPRTGRIAQLSGEPGDTIFTGDVFVKIEEKESTGVAPRQNNIETKPQAKNNSKDKKETHGDEPAKKVIAAPATRRLAREMNIDIQQIKGTGPAGRVTREDLLQFNPTDALADNPTVKDTVENAAKEGREKQTFEDIKGKNTSIPFLEMDHLPDYGKMGSVEIIPIRSLRKKVAFKTTTSSILIPHVAHMDECDVTELETMRKAFNTDHSDLGHLTLLSFTIKALASLLKTCPEFNASIDIHNMQIIHKKFYNIGFAANTQRGLIVPVINNTDQKNVIDIAHQIALLTKKGQDGSITLPELSNGTFSVTNLGSLGGTGLIPIINYPETAILGMGRVQKKPVVKDDSIVIRKMLPISLCFDHRVADGVKAGLFARDLKNMLENPLMFMTMI